MKPLIVLISLLFSICLKNYSQDLITKQNGDIINCKITNTDSLNVYFSTVIKEKEVNTFIPKSNVLKISICTLFICEEYY